MQFFEWFAVHTDGYQRGHSDAKREDNELSIEKVDKAHDLLVFYHPSEAATYLRKWKQDLLDESSRLRRD